MYMTVYLHVHCTCIHVCMYNINYRFITNNFQRYTCACNMYIVHVYIHVAAYCIGHGFMLYATCMLNFYEVYIKPVITIAT